MKIEFKAHDFIKFEDLKLNSLFVLSTDPIFVFIKYSSDHAAILNESSVDFNSNKDFTGLTVLPVKITSMNIGNYKE